MKPTDNIMSQDRNECCKARRAELECLLTTMAWLSDLKSDEDFQKNIFGMVIRILFL